MDGQISGDDGQYYSNVFVVGTPPAQFPAHLWGPSVQYPNPLMVTIHPTPPPNAVPLPTTTGEQLSAPGVPRTGTALGGPPIIGPMLPAQPAPEPLYGALRAPRADELIGGIGSNPATPLGLLGIGPF